MRRGELSVCGRIFAHVSMNFAALLFVDVPQWPLNRGTTKHTIISDPIDPLLAPLYVHD